MCVFVPLSQTVCVSLRGFLRLFMCMSWDRYVCVSVTVCVCVSVCVSGCLSVIVCVFNCVYTTVCVCV